MKTQNCGHRYSSFASECPHCARIAEDARLEAGNARIRIAARAGAEVALRKIEADRVQASFAEGARTGRAQTYCGFLKSSPPPSKPEPLRNMVLTLIILVTIFGTAIVMSLKNLQEDRALHLPSQAAAKR